jgi:hypothetical protein
MTQYINKSALVAEIERLIFVCDSVISDYDHREYRKMYEERRKAYVNVRNFLDTLEANEVNIAEMADDYYNALMQEADWMDVDTMAHCRLAYYMGCKDVLNIIRKGE